MNTAHRTSYASRSGALLGLASVVLALLTSAPAPARAQTIRKCTIAGSPVYQSSPCAVDAAAPTTARSTARPVAVQPAAQPVDTAAAPKKKSLAELLHARDGADAGRARLREAQSDGADVLRSRMGAI